MAITVTDSGEYGITGGSGATNTMTISRSYENGETTFTFQLSSSSSTASNVYSDNSVHSDAIPGVWIYITPSGGTQSAIYMDQKTIYSKPMTIYGEQHTINYVIGATVSFTLTGKSFTFYFQYLEAHTWRTTGTYSIQSYEESDLMVITLSGSFANNNLKAVTKITPILSTDSAIVSYTIGTKTETNSSAKNTVTKNFSTDWYSGLPSATSGTLTVTGTIKRGSATWMTMTKTLSVTIPNSVKPTISSYSVSDNNGYARYIKSYSAVKPAGTVTAGTGSSIKSISIKVGTMAATTKTDGTMPVSGTLTVTGTVACVLTATDNRNRSSTASVNITVYDKTGLISIALSGAFADSNLKAVMSYVLPKSSGYSATATYTLGTKTETPSSFAASTTKNFGDEWMDGIPTKTSGTLSVTVTIKQGSSTWATKTATRSVTVPSTVKPSVSAFAVAERLSTVPSSWGIYVQGLSAVRISTLTYTTPHSTASKISLKVGTATVKDGTPSNYPVSDVITQTGTVACKVTVTDARGRTGTRTVNITVYAYSAPSFTSALSERCDASGTADDEGTRFKVTTNVTFSSCNGKNSITLQVQSKPSTSSTYGTAQTISPNTSVVTNTTISPNASYDIRLTLTDAFSTSYHYDYISTALYLMHFKTGGNGIAFGQKATIDDTFDCNFAAAFRKGVTFTKSGGGTVTIDQIINALGL